MNKTAIIWLAAALLAGCVPTQLQPTFPSTPADKPAKVEPEKPKSEARTENRAPVTAKDINERNVKQTLRDLNSELEADLNDNDKDKPSKN